MTFVLFADMVLSVAFSGPAQYRPNLKTKSSAKWKIFKLKENGTNVRTEIVAGLTAFMTMAYIIALDPNLLTNFATGTPFSWRPA